MLYPKYLQNFCVKATYVSLYDELQNPTQVSFSDCLKDCLLMLNLELNKSLHYNEPILDKDGHIAHLAKLVNQVYKKLQAQSELLN